jgi:hypothetical protein
MKKMKTFDTVKMKNAIQAKHRRQRAGMSDEQVRRAVAEWVNASDHPVSRMWRGLAPDRTNRSSVGKA